MSNYNDFEDEKKDAGSPPEQHPEQAEPATGSTADTGANGGEAWSGSEVPPPASGGNGYGQGWQQPQYRPPVNGGYNPYTPTNQGYQSYPPVQGGQQPYYRAQGQYQYSTNSGWQQPQQQQRPPESYQWNFQDYEKAAGAKPKKKRNRGLVVFAVVLICVLSVGLIGISAYSVFNYVNESSSGEEIVSDGLNDGVPDDSSSAVSDAASLEIANKPQISESLPVSGKMTIPQVAKAVAPSVVSVIQYQTDYIEETGMGSGIVMSEDGYIITNAHVVSGGTDFKVILSDGTPKDADLIGADTITDLAVLKINDASGLTPAVFGDSNEIEVGESVIAIGNPAGEELAGSVTQGIISAVNRIIPNQGEMPFIQTDAAINPGNSGGPLVNEYGQVIGINSSKIVAQGYEGIGFAIPISEAKPIVDDIITNGRVTGRVKLGISGRTIDEIDARNSGLPMGIRIEVIDPDSDLFNKGVQKFDIITHIDGERIYDLDTLRTALNKHKPGDTVTLTIARPVGVTRAENYDVDVVLMEDK